MDDVRMVVMEVGIHDKDPHEEIVGVALCNQSVSLSYSKTRIHIPWTEIASWIKWLAKQSEEK